MSKKQEFKSLCIKYFDFLERDYGFIMVKGTVDTGIYKLMFKSSTVGIALEYEPREFYLFVTLCKLRKGEIPPKVVEISPKSVIECFDLDDVVSLSSKDSLVPDYTSMAPEEKITLDDLFKKQAENLRKFANDILNGDFSIFVELDRIVKDRAQKFAIQKWGDKASQFGWSLENSEREH
jgi:hypothetical protein